MSMLIATLGPPYVIARIARAKDSSLLTSFKESFQLYAKEAAGTLNVSNGVILYMLIINVVIFSVAILVGFFVLRKRMWARNIMILLMLILILRTPILQIVASGSVLMQVDTIIESIIFLMVIFFLTRKSATEYFQRG